MRTHVALTIGAGVAGFALVVYCFSYMTTRREPVAWQNGDLVFCAVSDTALDELLRLTHLLQENPADSGE